ncbi:hypothetical protein C8J57DRAFT_1475145 [Mycena rebaudengoi]|nr:hypothetical protein C8J57DRAFT_1475145 [Mycena rebaudengoi]
MARISYEQAQTGDRKNEGGGEATAHSKRYQGKYIRTNARCGEWKGRAGASALEKVSGDETGRKGESLVISAVSFERAQCCNDRPVARRTPGTRGVQRKGAGGAWCNEMVDVMVPGGEGKEVTKELGASVRGGEQNERNCTVGVAREDGNRENETHDDSRNDLVELKGRQQGGNRVSKAKGHSAQLRDASVDGWPLASSQRRVAHIGFRQATRRSVDESREKAARADPANNLSRLRKQLRTNSGRSLLRSIHRSPISKIPLVNSGIFVGATTLPRDGNLQEQENRVLPGCVSIKGACAHRVDGENEDGWC